MGSEIVEEFHGVYLLYSTNPRFKGRTYVGYTRDVNRRLRQHNRGTWAGGAYRTNNKGPWKMVLVVHGFPNNISALRFEWVWQHPEKSTRLRHLEHPKKMTKKENEYEYKLRILAEMLKSPPWMVLPLSLRWLEFDYFKEFPVDRKIPEHMNICHGQIKCKNKTRQQIDNLLNQHEITDCHLCFEPIIEAKVKLKCLHCPLVCHLTCLAQLFIIPGQYIPIEGMCPLCDKTLKWGELIRRIYITDEKDMIYSSNDESDSSKE